MDAYLDANGTDGSDPSLIDKVYPDGSRIALSDAEAVAAADAQWDGSRAAALGELLLSWVANSGGASTSTSADTGVSSDAAPSADEKADVLLEFLVLRGLIG
jgi:hypothetical protein